MTPENRKQHPAVRAAKAPPVHPSARKMGAAEGLPPDAAEDLAGIAADDAGTSAMAERAAEGAERRQ
jgi:hypothetical protein